MKKEGGCEWYQSMGLIFLYISANFLLFFKGPRPFKSHKTNISCLTTQYAPRLNRGTSAAKKHDSGQDIAWIFLDSGSYIFRSRRICKLFYFQFSSIFDGEGGGGSQIRRMKEGGKERAKFQTKKIRQQLVANNSKNSTVYTFRFADFLIHIARG